jgi:plastocyanin
MNRTARVATLAATTVLGLSALAACSSSSDTASSGAESPAPSSSAPSSAAPSSSAPSSAAPSADAAKTATITIKDFKYDGPTSVAPGTKITITNEDSEAHTVTAASGDAFDVKIDPGKSATLTAPASGTYKFDCTFHGNMHGTLKVT